jgi:YD repeat-containing protein
MGVDAFEANTQVIELSHVGLQGPPGPAGNAGSEEVDPLFSYSSGRLSLITYESGNTRAFSYNLGGQLTSEVYLAPPLTYTKTFTYNLDGTLSGIVETVT